MPECVPCAHRLALDADAVDVLTQTCASTEVLRNNTEVLVTYSHEMQVFSGPSCLRVRFWHSYAGACDAVGVLRQNSTTCFPEPSAFLQSPLPLVNRDCAVACPPGCSPSAVCAYGSLVVR